MGWKVFSSSMWFLKNVMRIRREGKPQQGEGLLQVIEAPETFQGMCC